MNKKLISAIAAISLAVSSAVSLTSSASENSATTTYPVHSCDVNQDGDTNMGDVVAILQYLAGSYSIPNPRTADFDNDGFISEVDYYMLQKDILGYSVSVNPDYVSGSTSLRNTTMRYNRYRASTGSLIETYTVSAAPSVTAVSSRSVIGTDTRYPDYSHTGICKITTNDGATATGFVASDDTILTAGHVLKNKTISSIKFYNSYNIEVFTANAQNYSIPTNYVENSYTDYALISVSNDLSAYNVFGFGYALSRAIEEQAYVYVTGFSNNLAYESTGAGRLQMLSGRNELKYNCDTDAAASGAPVYTDIVYEGRHYYTVIGIHTSETSSNITNNSGVRMCPNIRNLIRAN